MKATVDAQDGSTVQSYEWTQAAGAAATIASATSQSATVTLADAAAYKAELTGGLAIEDRVNVQGINPHSLEAAEEVTFKVTVTTSSGTYSDTVSVTTHLPYAISTGIQNVPVGVPVLLNAKVQDTYSWSLTAASGSSATLVDASDRNPSFTPDVVGKYTLSEANSGATIDVYAGKWVGAISGQDANGRPLSSSCTMCHNGTVAADQFTPWKESGHAEIFTNNLNTSAYWGEQCFACHTVGFDKAVANGGIDEASDYTAFLGLLHKPNPNNWTTTLAEYPNTARLANIQCENCHGPNDSALHMAGTGERVSVSSDVCGSCHGEPLRHGRYQQWEESKHGDFTLAIERGTNTSCARCHSAQGFIAWTASGNPDQDLDESAITWTADTVQPVTCVACHDPHYVGTKSGEPNDANLRVSGDATLLAGFTAENVGKGALCMTCHNARRGLRNDAVASTLSESDLGRAPHGATQADVLMGQNAFYVTVGTTSPHATFIADTCTRCHLVLQDPPAELSHNLGGTNHTFEASHDICSSCHGTALADTLHDSVENLAEQLKEALESAILAEIAAQTGAGNTVTLKGFGEGGADVAVTDGSTVTAVDYIGSYHGRQAIDITVAGTTYEHVRIGPDTAVGTGSLLTSAAGQTIAKAGWNYNLIKNDGSHGAHNPGFTIDVLNAARDALK